MDSTVHAEILSFLRDRKSVTASISSLATATPKMEQDSGTEVEPAFYVRLIGAAAVTVTDASGKSTGPPNFSSVPGVTLYITGEGSWLVILQQNQPYSVSFRSGNDAMTVEITKGTDVSTTVAVRYTDLVIPSGAAAVLKLNPQARLEVEPLRYDSDRNGTFDTEVMPTVVVEGPDADDVEAPTIEFSATVLPTVTLVDITAKDAATGVKTLFFSLDGTNFLPYAGTLTVNPAQSPIVYAFAEDNVANRSGLFTFDLCQLIHACELVNVNNFVMSFVPLDTTFTITDDRSGCPVGFIGKFSFSARLTDKITSPPLSDLRVRVKTITNGHVLQNAIGGLAGVGAQLIVPRVGDFKDGVLSPRESVDVPFVFCLNEKEPFTFLLDVLGAVADKRRHPFRRD